MGCTGTEIVYREVEGDQTIPEGWKSAECANINFSKVFWDSDMKFLSSRAEAVRMMLTDKKNYTPREIETMKRGLASDGWEKHIGLPEGWMYRSVPLFITSWERVVTDHQFLSPEFEVIHDPGAVLKRFMVFGNFKSESVFSKFVLNFCIGVPKDQIESFEWIEGSHKLRLGKFFLKSDGGVIQTILTQIGTFFKNNCNKFLDEVMADDAYLPSEKEEISDLLKKHLSVKTRYRSLHQELLPKVYQPSRRILMSGWKMKIFQWDGNQDEKLCSKATTKGS
eukprot:TRINITY_DN12305_c0_g1_i1.p1 TRINITY_DN12305_c0_g1~~TRINITY_DN12305_c0_g1_i1.p1  ORF type:complete len:280 (-),score=57.76 TRINITY_DN12305_c0_g1_i1:25-864(-)